MRFFARHAALQQLCQAYCKGTLFLPYIALLALLCWSCGREKETSDFSDLPQEEPIAVWLSWSSQPESTIVVQWLTMSGEKEGQRSREGAAKRRDIVWQRIDDGMETLPSSSLSHERLLPLDDRFLLHTAEIGQLTPNSRYRFSLPERDNIYLFRTLPERLEENERLQIIVGGDLYQGDSPLLRRMNSIAARCSPHFALLGGDIAYAASSSIEGKDDVMRWIDWLSIWSKTMVTSEGYLIPIVAILGNHDVNGGFTASSERAELFHALFPFPGQRGFNSLDIGDYLSLFGLDSGHTNSIDGEQSRWLRSALDERRHRPYLMAAYHVPAYPSVRPFDSYYSRTIRDNWSAIFDDFLLDIALEHHDHAYKRTFPLRGGEIEREGVIYLGDGAWAVHNVRRPRRKRPYLAKTAQRRHVIAIEIAREKLSCTVLDERGRVIDHFTKPKRQHH